MVDERVLFTVFTATYNRAHTLSRVYRSLSAQTFRDFEWIVVDDGSSDGTAEMVRQWSESASFRISLFRQSNGGKCRAVNRGVKEARGELFLNLDSDDECVPRALERLRYHWETIPLDRRDEFSSVAGLAMDTDGRIIGDPFPLDPMDSDPVDMRFVKRIRGDKWGFQRTAVMREFPFPVIEGEKYMADGLIWHRIAEKYLTRYVNEALRIYHSTPDSWGSTVGPRALNPRGYVLYYFELATLKRRLPPTVRIRHASNYVRFSLHAAVPVITQARLLGRHRLLAWLAGLIPGWFLYQRDKSELSGSRA